MKAEYFQCNCTPKPLTFMKSQSKKSGSWKINSNGELIYLSDTKEQLVSALEIIRSEFYETEKGKPSDDYPNIKITKSPLGAKLVIDSLKVREEICISATIVLLNPISQVKITTVSLSQDHIIHADTWYPIIVEDIEDINHILSQCEVKDLADIPLRSYLKLKRIGGYESILEFSETKTEALEGVKVDHPEITGFNATLYDYQVTGFRWMLKISKESFGCILADEMGLGKTIQVIALIHKELEESKNPSLVICPSSLLVNWSREFRKFSPGIRTYIHSGSQRTGFPEILRKFDVIITNYDTVIRDLSLFEQVSWNFLICDEAQAVKNPHAKRTRYIKKIENRVCIAVTGTPFENRLLDIWSIVDLVAKDLLGSIESFTTEFPDSIQGAEKLEPFITPLILRRKVLEVAKDLPERIDIPQPIQMDEKLISYYDQFRTDILNKYGTKATLVSIQLLRMFCCEPSLALKDGIDYDNMNTKFQRLKELVLEIYKSGEKALIFTSYHEVADKIRRTIRSDLKCYVNWINGRVKIEERQTIIDEFSEIIGPAFLVLNPKAAGTGLNITAANHVIHYNLEWNPSVEDQASARAYRRGQTKPVFIYRLFYTDTIDEYIDSRIEFKRKISKKSIIGTDGESEQLGDIYEALQYTPLNPLK